MPTGLRPRRFVLIDKTVYPKHEWQSEIKDVRRRCPDEEDINAGGFGQSATHQKKYFDPRTKPKTK